MNRQQMIDFALYVLRCSPEARQFGGLRFEAEEIVDRYCKEQK